MATRSSSPYNARLQRIITLCQSYCPAVILGDSQWDGNASAFRMEQALMRGLPSVVPWAGRGLEDGTSSSDNHTAQGIFGFAGTYAGFPRTQHRFLFDTDNTWADGSVNLAPRTSHERIAPNPPVAISGAELIRLALSSNFYRWVENGNQYVTADQWPIHHPIKFTLLFRNDPETPLDMEFIRTRHARYTANGGSPASATLTEVGFPGLAMPTTGGYFTIESTVQTTVNAATGDPVFHASTEFIYTPGAAGMALGFIGAKAERVDGNGDPLPGLMPYVIQAPSAHSHHHSDEDPQYSDAAIDALLEHLIQPKLLVMMFHNDTTGFADGCVDVYDRWVGRMAAASLAAPHVLIIAPWVSGSSGTRESFSVARTDELYALCQARGWSFLNLHDWYGGARPDEATGTPMDSSPDYTFDTVHPTTQEDIQGLAEAFYWNFTHLAGGGARGRRHTLGIY